MRATSESLEELTMGPRRIGLWAEGFRPLFMSPDSQRLFTVSWPSWPSSGASKLKVHSLLTEKVPEVIEDREHTIEDAAILARSFASPTKLVSSGCGQSMAVLLSGGLVKLVDLTTYEPVDGDFMRVGEGACQLACSADGNRMAIGYSGLPRNPQIAVFDTTTRKKVQELDGARTWSGCGRVFFSPDGSHVIAIDSGNWLAVWNREGKLVKEDNTDDYHETRQGTGVAVTPDSTKLLYLHNTAAGGGPFLGYLVRMHDLTSNKTVREWQFPGALRALDVSPDGRRILVAGGHLKVPEYEGICEWSLDAPDGAVGDHCSFSIIATLRDEDLTFARFAPDGSKIVAASFEVTPERSVTGNKFITVYDYPKHFVL